MSARKIKTRQENRSKSEFYLKKAGDNYKQMMKALKDKNYNAAGTLAVQCAISAGDAVSVHEKGIRSVSENHLDLCELVKTVPRVQATKKSNTLKRIISKKSLIQYESRSIRRVEAETLVKSTIRFFRWAADVVK